MPETLEPIDSVQCQAEKCGGSFMTFGRRPSIRCANTPIWIAVSVKDGQFDGAMSLCDACKKVCEQVLPAVSFQRLLPVAA